MKFSYAAVTRGTTIANPLIVTSMQECLPDFNTSVPLASPVPMVHRHQVQTQPYTRVFPNHHLPGHCTPTPWQNHFIFSSMGAVQPGTLQPSAVADQAVQIYSAFPTHKVTPISGAYPVHQAPTSRCSTGYKSPKTKATHVESKPRPSPKYPPPSTTRFPDNPFASYPPPPFSPISQFRSPPPPVPQQAQPPTPLSSVPSKLHEDEQPRNSEKNDAIPEGTTVDASDRLRSVSYSSDECPPASLNLARVSHQTQLPLSPSYTTMSGVVPLPANVDTSVPPPPLATPPRSQSPTSCVTFNQENKRTWRPTRSPRISISEISDMSSPQPVRSNKAVSNIRLSLANHKKDNVFSF